MNSLWQGAFVVAIATGVTAFVPQRHAATRYAVWFAALISLAILPLSGLISFGDSPAIPSSVIRTTTVASHLTSQAANAEGLWLATLWALGCIACMSRLTLSYFTIARIATSSVRAPYLGEDVVVSPLISIPVATGFVRPLVILPEHVANALDPADLASILAHERAHIRRNDIAGNLIQRLVEALLFFNPWVYVIGRQLVKEREAACDDWAVRASSDPDRYASCLAALAQRAPRTTTPLLTPSAIGSGRMLVGRIARIVNGKAGHVKINYVVVSTAIALFGVLGFAFQTPTTLASTAALVAASSSSMPAKCSANVMVLNAVPPDIPSSYLKAHPHAQAEISVTVQADGTPTHVMMVGASDEVIAKATTEAALHSTYKPEVRNCKAVSGGKYLFKAQVGP